MGNLNQPPWNHLESWDNSSVLERLENRHIKGANQEDDEKKQSETACKSRVCLNMNIVGIPQAHRFITSPLVDVL